MFKLRLSSFCAIALLTFSMVVSPHLLIESGLETGGIEAQARLKDRIKARKGEHDRKKQIEKISTEQPQGLPPMRMWVNPNRPPKLCLLCIHGLGLNAGSFEFFGKQASKRGLAVYAMDVRGFGAWMNAGGKTQVDFEGCLSDVKQTVLAIRQKHPGLPVFLLGESMGGAIALRAASLFPDIIDGLISSVPAEERFKQGKTNVKVAMSILRPRKKPDVGTDVVNQATTNEALRREWESDPLNRLDLSAKELIQFQAFMNDNHNSAEHVTEMPVLFVQGTKDKLVKPEGTWDLFGKVTSVDKVFIAIPGEHLIFEESQLQNPAIRGQNMMLVASWLVSKVGWRNLRSGPGNMTRNNNAPANVMNNNQRRQPGMLRQRMMQMRQGRGPVPPQTPGGY